MTSGTEMGGQVELCPVCGQRLSSWLGDCPNCYRAFSRFYNKKDLFLLGLLHRLIRTRGGDLWSIKPKQALTQEIGISTPAVPH